MYVSKYSFADVGFKCQCKEIKNVELVTLHYANFFFMGPGFGHVMEIASSHFYQLKMKTNLI